MVLQKMILLLTKCIPLLQDKKLLKQTPVEPSMKLPTGFHPKFESIKIVKACKGQKLEAASFKTIKNINVVQQPVKASHL